MMGNGGEPIGVTVGEPKFMIPRVAAGVLTAHRLTVQLDSVDFLIETVEQERQPKWRHRVPRASEIGNCLVMMVWLSADPSFSITSRVSAVCCTLSVRASERADTKSARIRTLFGSSETEDTSPTRRQWSEEAGQQRVETRGYPSE